MMALPSEGALDRRARARQARLTTLHPTGQNGIPGFESGKSVLLVPPRDASALAAAHDDAHGRSELRSRLSAGRRGRERATPVAADRLGRARRLRAARAEPNDGERHPDSGVARVAYPGRRCWLSWSAPARHIYRLPCRRSARRPSCPAGWAGGAPGQAACRASRLCQPWSPCCHSQWCRCAWRSAHGARRRADLPVSVGWLARASQRGERIESTRTGVALLFAR